MRSRALPRSSRSPPPVALLRRHGGVHGRGGRYCRHHRHLLPSRRAPTHPIPSAPRAFVKHQMLAAAAPIWSKESLARSTSPGTAQAAAARLSPTATTPLPPTLLSSASSHKIAAPSRTLDWGVHGGGGEGWREQRRCPGGRQRALPWNGVGGGGEGGFLRRMPQPADLRRCPQRPRSCCRQGGRPGGTPPSPRPAAARKLRTAPRKGAAAVSSMLISP